MSFTVSIPGIDQSSIDAVISIAEYIIKKNRIIKIDKLFKRAKRELDLDSRVLLTIIKRLFKEKYLVEGSKLIKQELLKNPYRAAIYYFIKKVPGVNFSAIKKFAPSNKNIETIEKINKDDLEFRNTGQFIWHLEVLLKFGCIKKISYKKYSLFIPAKMNSEMGILHFLLRNKKYNLLLSYLIQNNSIEQKEIPNIINIPEGNVYYLKKNLKELNLIYSKKSGRSSLIFLNSEKRDILNNVFKDIRVNLLKLKTSQLTLSKLDYFKAKNKNLQT